MASTRDMLIAILAFIALAAAGLAASWWFRHTNASPRPPAYMMRLGADSKFVPAGELRFDEQEFRCGRRPTVLAPRFDDYAAAFYGYLIVNPTRFETLPLILKRYAYAHECGHQFVGWDEEMADCYAVRIGKAEGWLDSAGMETICGFISKSKGDLRHPPGVRRCAVMRKCFARSRPGKETYD